MNKERLQQEVTLADGRTLSFAEYGESNGRPIFYFHGFPGSRLDWLLGSDETVLKELKIRIIAPDRPDMGYSDYKPHRTVLEWPADVLELADALNCDHFSVLGVSGGGPYAASCARFIKNRVLNTGIVSGMGPSEAPGMQNGAS